VSAGGGWVRRPRRAIAIFRTNLAAPIHPTNVCGRSRAGYAGHATAAPPPNPSRLANPPPAGQRLSAARSPFSGAIPLYQLTGGLLSVARVALVGGCARAARLPFPGADFAAPAHRLLVPCGKGRAGRVVCPRRATPIPWVGKLGYTNPPGHCSPLQQPHESGPAPAPRKGHSPGPTPPHQPADSCSLRQQPCGSGPAPAPRNCHSRGATPLHQPTGGLFSVARAAWVGLCARPARLPFPGGSSARPTRRLPVPCGKGRDGRVVRPRRAFTVLLL
jgi:hypothetical protein